MILEIVKLYSQNRITIETLSNSLEEEYYFLEKPRILEMISGLISNFEPNNIPFEIFCIDLLIKISKELSTSLKLQIEFLNFEKETSDRKFNNLQKVNKSQKEELEILEKIMNAFFN